MDTNIAHKPVFRYSTISDYHKCGQYYWLKQICGESDGGEKSGDMAFGTALHMACEEITLGKGDGEELFTLFWDTCHEKEFTRLKWDDLLDMGKDFLTMFREDEAPALIDGLKEAELKMSHDYGDYIISGTADYIGTYKNVLSILDYKTSAMPYTGRKLISNEQMYLYAELAKHSGYAVTQLVYMVFVKDPKNPRIQLKIEELTEDVLQKKMENIHNTCQAILNTKAWLRNTSSCAPYAPKVCPFFDRCYGVTSAR